jgi:hypothetical protein
MSILALFITWSGATDAIILSVSMTLMRGFQDRTLSAPRVVGGAEGDEKKVLG